MFGRMQIAKDLIELLVYLLVCSFYNLFYRNDYFLIAIFTACLSPFGTTNWEITFFEWLFWLFIIPFTMLKTEVVLYFSLFFDCKNAWMPLVFYSG